jgi:hypothetical protein
MDEHSMILRRVEYQTSLVDGGSGLVIAHERENGRVVVIDEEDGSRWAGYEDYVTLLDA